MLLIYPGIPFSVNMINKSGPSQLIFGAGLFTFGLVGSYCLTKYFNEKHKILEKEHEDNSIEDSIFTNRTLF